ncbi:hypothetical protein OROHE_016107 [Orobanche hederae]
MYNEACISPIRLEKATLKEIEQKYIDTKFFFTHELQQKREIDVCVPETLVLYIFHLFNNSFHGPLEYDPLSDPVLYEICHDSDDVTGDSQVGPFGYLEQGCTSHGMNDNNPPQNQVFGDQSMPLSVLTFQDNCVYCHILGEITHTNGDYFSQGEHSDGEEVLGPTFKQEGYTPMQDPISTFYEALCVGLNEPETTNDFP